MILFLFASVTLIPSASVPATAIQRKRVLVLAYSQTGQLTAVIESLLGPLRADPRISVHVETLAPQPPFPMPWPLFRFLDAFPESANLQPGALAPLTLTGDEDFDLVILPYQVWFLAPSQPVAAFLKHPVAARLLRGKPVVTVIACRNMWLLAHGKTKKLLADLGAHLVDNVVLTDRAHTMATLLTTPLWLLTGKRQLISSLPPAGVAATDIEGCARFGRALRDALAEDRERSLEPMLQGLRAVEADPNLWFSELTAGRSFSLWGRLLRAFGPPGSLPRRALLVLYLVFLVTLVFTVVPLSLAIQLLLRPCLKQRLARLKQSFEAPSGSGDERLSLYDC